jgi:hypothetical protein
MAGQGLLQRLVMISKDFGFALYGAAGVAVNRKW